MANLDRKLNCEVTLFDDFRLVVATITMTMIRLDIIYSVFLLLYMTAYDTMAL